MVDDNSLREKVLASQRATREVEREFLLARGWEEQATVNGVTWWYFDGLSGSEPQATAIKYALKDLEKVFGRQDREREEILASPVSILKLGVRARNGVRRMNCETVGDLIRVDANLMMELRNFGVVALGEIRTALRRYGLKLKGD